MHLLGANTNPVIDRAGRKSIHVDWVSIVEFEISMIFTIFFGTTP